MLLIDFALCELPLPLCSFHNDILHPRYKPRDSIKNLVVHALQRDLNPDLLVSQPAVWPKSACGSCH